MKKQYILSFALVLLILLSTCALAQNEGDFTYSAINGEATITGYTGCAAELPLPDTLGGYPVTAINYCAFRNCASLTQVIIPDGVTAIGSRAFQNCASLTQIVIPKSVSRIDTHAFRGCSALKQIMLPDNIGSIHSLAFYGCSAIRYCSPDSLTARTLTDVGSSFRSPDNPLLTLKAYENADGQLSFAVDDCDESAVSVAFPDHVTAIERYAFFNCARLTEIVLPDGITEIAQSTFEGCRSLTRITIPGSVGRIADDAFSGCSNLTIIAPPGSAGQAFAEANAANGFSWQAL